MLKAIDWRNLPVTRSLVQTRVLTFDEGNTLRRPRGGSKITQPILGS